MTPDEQQEEPGHKIAEALGHLGTPTCRECLGIGIVVRTDPKETYNLHSAGEPCDCPEGEPYR